MRYEVKYWKDLSLSPLQEEIDGIMHIEVWLDVDGFEGLYQVSSFGRIKNVKHILRQTKDKLDYVRVSLCKNGTVVKRQVHLLVGRAFIPNPEGKKTINHKKGNPLDNRCWMLEWNTQKENIQHSFNKLGRVSNLKGKGGQDWPHYNKIHPAFGKTHVRPNRQRGLHQRARKINCDTLGLAFNCIKDVSDIIGLSTVSIHKVLNGTRLHSEGLVFRYI